MRSIVLALVVSISASAILYLLATTFNAPEEVAKGMAGLPALGLKNLYEFLQVKSAKRAIREDGPDSIETPTEFGINPLIISLVGGLAFFGMYNVTGVLGYFMLNLGFFVSDAPLASNLIFVAITIQFTQLPFRIVSTLYIGHWIGSRARSFGFSAGIASVVLGFWISILSNLVFLSNIDFSAIVGFGTTTWIRLLVESADLIFYLPTILVGVWFGRRWRLTRYLRFLLMVLPAETRSAIVGLTRDEAIKVEHARALLHARNL